MKRLSILAVMLLLCLAADHRKVQSPKGAELESTAGRKMAATIRAAIPSPIVPVPDRWPRVITNHVSWRWPDIMEGVVGFYVYRGTNSQIYFTKVSVGLVTNVDVSYLRNALEQDYFIATAFDENGAESEISNEALFPAPNVQPVVDWVRIWTTNVASMVLQIRTNQFNPNDWQDYGRIVQDNSYLVPANLPFANFRAITFNPEETNIWLQFEKVSQ